MKRRMKKLLSTLCLVSALLLALTVNVSAETGAAASVFGGSGYMIVMIVVMIAVFYFLLIRPENKKRKKAELEYSMGMVLKEGLPQGCREKFLEGGRYIQFEMEDDYEIRDLMEIYQQMESSIFLKWYYDNELILSTTKEKLVRYKDGRLYSYLPLEE